eukprot:347345-Prymnesium_polylepis.1
MWVELYSAVFHGCSLSPSTSGPSATAATMSWSARRPWLCRRLNSPVLAWRSPLRSTGSPAASSRSHASA